MIKSIVSLEETKKQVRDLVGAEITYLVYWQEILVHGTKKIKEKKNDRKTHTGAYLGFETSTRNVKGQRPTCWPTQFLIY